MLCSARTISCRHCPCKGRRALSPVCPCKGRPHNHLVCQYPFPKPRPYYCSHRVLQGSFVQPQNSLPTHHEVFQNAIYRGLNQSELSGKQGPQANQTTQPVPEPKTPYHILSCTLGVISHKADSEFHPMSPSYTSDPPPRRVADHIIIWQLERYKIQGLVEVPLQRACSERGLLKPRTVHLGAGQE